jgi:PilZ domain
VQLRQAVEQIVELSADAQITKRKTAKDSPGFDNLTGVVATLEQRRGRMERRLPIVVIVRLAPTEGAGSDGEERTYTDNISAHGACIFSTRTWKLGGKVRVTPTNEVLTACGKVVYCSRRADNRYEVGVQFQDGPVMWSALRRYGGP